MTSGGRSLDDLPLAAYSTGTEPDARFDVAEPERPAPAAPAADRPAAAPPFAPFAKAEPEQPHAVDGDVDVDVARPARRLPALPEWLANPRAHTRDPRLMLTGAIGAGVVLLAASLVLGGGGPLGAVAADASPSAGTLVATPAPPTGSASVEVTGKLAATYALAGLVGLDPATPSRMAASWGDVSGATLSIGGPVSAGTRWTDAGFVLTWTAMVDGAPVTFTSKAHECTVGMAVTPKAVSGSFVCKDLRSDDGKHTVEARGTYRT
jgi:hypothetical protein